MTYLKTSKSHGVTRRKWVPYAVTPHIHGVTTAYAENLAKPIYSLGYTYGVNHGVKHNQSHTPSRAKYYLA